jgi:hypothetical protein
MFMRTHAHCTVGSSAILFSTQLCDAKAGTLQIPFLLFQLPLLVCKSGALEGNWKSGGVPVSGDRNLVLSVLLQFLLASPSNSSSSRQ